METVPDEVIISEILSSMTLPQILQTCSVNQQFARICQDPVLWNALVQRDFPYEYPLNPGIRWREYYMIVYQSPILPIYHQEDPVDWVRLTPYNLEKVLGLIQGLLQRMNLSDYQVVFTGTDYELEPLADFSRGEFHILNPALPMRKIVLVPSGLPVTSHSVLQTLTTPGPIAPPVMYPRLPIYGLVRNDGTVWVGYQRFRHIDEVPGKPCDRLTANELEIILPSLHLWEEASSLNWLNQLERVPGVRPGGWRPSRPAAEGLCRLILTRLRLLGRILNEVAPPNKPLLENVAPSPPY